MAVNNRTAEALETLSQGIARLTSSEHWLDYLRAQRAFHNYSFGNVMLIASQRPDASRVAGFHSWLKLGRHVLRGEHAIWILAPMIRRRPGPELDVDHDDEGVVMGFRAVPVWDISQTAGEDLPRCAPGSFAGRDGRLSTPCGRSQAGSVTPSRMTPISLARPTATATSPSVGSESVAASQRRRR